jgi:hypothetical protein
MGLFAALCIGAIALAACGGGGDDGDEEDGTPSATRVSRTGTPARTGTAVGTARPGTPGAEGTAALAATPAPGTTAAAEATQAAAQETPGAAPTLGTGGNTPIAGGPPPTPSPNEQAHYADLASSPEFSSQFVGGDVNAPPEVLTDLPEPPPGATIDPSTIAPPDPGTSDVEFIIDLNASEPGIQATRTIRVGDVIRIGVVVTGVPPFDNGIGGLAAFNFSVEYDRNVVVAPTIINGSALARNPDLNDEGLGGATPNWSCLLPAPEGDADDPGGFTGDGDPATGQAMISCFADGGAGYMAGDLVIATIQFQAVGSGSTTIALDDGFADAFTFAQQPFTHASCVAEPLVPCRSATLTVD